MAILIKRYANRKLYNTDTSRYITLKGISELLDVGEEVQVVDNETGEDITSVALSQILVDSKRSNTSPPHTLLSQIFGRSGDVLYEALRKGVDDATDGLGELEKRVRRIVQTDERGDDETREASARGATHSGKAAGNTNEASGQTRSRSRESARSKERAGLGSWIHLTTPDLEKLVQSSVERVFRLLDLPRRSDIVALNENLERVAAAVDDLQAAYRPGPATRPDAADPSAQAPAEVTGTPGSQTEAPPDAPRAPQ
jgi:polyhydroxyalkanoate synthesis repressor PhaR